MPPATQKAGKRGKEVGKPSLSRKDQQKADEAKMAKAVKAEMNKVAGMGKKSDAFDFKVKKALLRAAMRSKLMSKEQHSIKTLPKFQLDIKCSAHDLEMFFEDRRFRNQMVASLNIVNGIVATPPKDHILYQLIELMESQGEGKKPKSIMQFAMNEFDGYLGGFRKTPDYPNEYQPDGFFVFEEVELPAFFGKTYRLGHTEGYASTTQVELQSGFLQIMVDRLLEHITIYNYRLNMPERHPYLEAPMIFFGECQRSGEVRECVVGKKDGPFGLLTDPLDTPEEAVVFNVTVDMDSLFHNWSAMSKVGLLFYIAILELVGGPFSDAHISFIKARIGLRRLVHKMGEDGYGIQNLQLYDAQGIFSLKKLLGRYVLLVKYEEGLVARCIMRDKSKFVAVYDRCANSQENERLQRLWDSCGDEESDDEELDAERLERVYHSDKVEWDRWLGINGEEGVNLFEKLME